MRSVIGQSIHRIDGQDKVTGKAIYTSDIKIPGMVYGKALRSPIPHGRVRRINSKKAESMPGVLAVLTRENLQVAFPYRGGYIKDQPIVALEKVRYAGDIVAAVATTDEELAEEALSKIEVDYEDLPAVLTIDEALKENAPLVHENLHVPQYRGYGKGASHIVHENTNIFYHFRYERGDIEKGLASADFVFEDTFFFPSAHHYPMEAAIGIAHFEGGSFTIWSSTQVPFSTRQEIARTFGLPLSRVRVIVPYVGGGYGGSKSGMASLLAAALSRLADRPVRVAFSAEENFKTICQPRAKMTIKTGVKKDGTFIARRCEVYINGGAYTYSCVAVTEKAGYRAAGPYRIPHLLSDAYGVYTNTVPGSAFRGFGGPQVVFAYESHLDMIAHRLKMDPLNLRMKNLLNRGEEYAPGDTPIDCDLKRGLKQVAEAIEWGKKVEAVKGSGVKRGKGIGCGVKDGGGAGKPAHAIVKILNDGSIVLFSGSVEIGQGVRTAFLQIVAQELSVSPDKIQVAEIDTNYTPYDMGTNASSSTTVMGQAVQRAARDARQQLLSAAASVFGSKVTQVELREEGIFCKDKNMSFQEIMGLYLRESRGEITGRGFFQFPRDDKCPLGHPSPFWEIGMGAAEVEVDEMTGEVRILKYVSLTDAGKMIHPIQCQGQEEGSVMFGIGESLFEDLVYQDGQLTNPNLVDYRLPSFQDFPRSFTSFILEEGGGPGPYGAKGMGEGGILGVAPAVCNAVYDAIGVRISKVPLKGEMVLRAIKGASETLKVYY